MHFSCFCWASKYNLENPKKRGMYFIKGTPLSLYSIGLFLKSVSLQNEMFDGILNLMNHCQFPCLLAFIYHIKAFINKVSHNTALIES